MFFAFIRTAALVADDFPLYAHLITLDEPGSEIARRDFKAAKTGGSKERYQFAVGLTTFLGNNRAMGLQIPGVTEEMLDQTTEAVIKLLQGIRSDAAVANHVEYLLDYLGGPTNAN